MSSILDFATTDVIFPNADAGFDVYGDPTEDNFIRISGEGEDNVFGGNALDFISTGNGDDNIDGGAGNDTLSGGDGNDLIDGGAGNDLIDGGAGDDTISGGEGQDTFVLEFFDNGVDTISDFQVEEDKIVIKGVGADAQVSYDEMTGKLSVDGQEIANLQPGLDFTDENYDIY